MISTSHLKDSAGVTVLQRKKYGCLCKIFCCKCVYCCQSIDFSLLTSEHRKGVFFTMINQYIHSIEKQPNVIIDPFFILLGLLLGEKDEEINAATLLQIGDTSEKQAIFSKQDLQMYIPQLCTYLVFHEQMENIPIFNLLERTARFDIQFALTYFSYMKSLQIINENTEFQVVQKYNKTFLKKIQNHFKNSVDNSSQLTLEDTENTIKAYNGRSNAMPKQFQFQKIAFAPPRKNYKACFAENITADGEIGVFGSSLNFLNDLVTLGYNLIKVTDRKTTLVQYLQQINHRLPADVYLPLKNPIYKGMKVANIVFEECKVFSTKMRAPYCICLQIYEEKIQVQSSKFKRIVSTMNINESQLRKSHLFEQDTVEEETVASEKQTKSPKKQQNKTQGWISKFYRLAKGATNFYKNQTLKQQQSTNNEIILSNEDEHITKLFGQSALEQEGRIKNFSPFSELPKHRIVNFMVKTEDDLRQQAFAMQLLQEFNSIFKMEGLPIKVIPYQVVPLGHNCGIIGFLKDALTVDEIIKREGNLHFLKKNNARLQNFVHTLVGYSLVTYILQIKDRHNGNIMINRDGCIIHIDFGFFMSNAPGKGVELQKKVAFKMTNEYIDIMGGLESKQFQDFRKLFFQGYQACRKHQHRILIMTKLMYSSHGTTMPCFMKGNQAIDQLQDRLNPKGTRTDGDLSLYCQSLVNSSIDNWRARWYDKWQYYMQGILY